MKILHSNQKCYLCGSHDYFERPGKVRDNHQLKVLECKNCSLVFLSSFDHVFDGFYEESGMHNETEIVELEDWISATLEDDERRFHYFYKMIKGVNLLDFGCGVGGFLLKSRVIANLAEGIEPEKRLSTYFNKNGLTVYQNIREVPNCDYDVITLFHVLEHLPDPIIELQNLKKLLNSNGKIIIEVPNSNDALLSLYKSKAFSNFTYWSPHLFLFNEETLRILCEKVGFSKIKISQFQRYGLANHLYWLAQGRPGGHNIWDFMKSDELDLSYMKKLNELGMCDTIIAELSV